MNSNKAIYILISFIAIIILTLLLSPTNISKSLVESPPSKPHTIDSTINSIHENEYPNVKVVESKQEITSPHNIAKNSSDILIEGETLTDEEIELLEAQKKSDDFFNSKAFSSPDNINSAYVYNDGTVSMTNLTNSFVNNDFSKLVNKLNQIEQNEISINRQIKLNETLYKAFGSSIHDEQFSCGGNVCAVTFKSVNELPDEKFTELSEFSKNYTFKNTSTNEIGESVIKILYIAAENPSELSVR